MVAGTQVKGNEILSIDVNQARRIAQASQKIVVGMKIFEELLTRISPGSQLFYVRLLKLTVLSPEKLVQNACTRTAPPMEQ